MAFDAGTPAFDRESQPKRAGAHTLAGNRVIRHTKDVDFSLAMQRCVSVACFNEAQKILGLPDAVHKAPLDSLEVTLINDSYTDGTKSILAEAKAAAKVDLRIKHQPPKRQGRRFAYRPERSQGRKLHRSR